MKLLQVTVILSMSLLLGNSFVFGQWLQTNGPYEGYVTAIAGTGDTLYVGTDGTGVFRSSDNGTTWSAANSGLTTFGINCLACIGATTLAGTGQGIFVSTNSGSTWISSNSGLTNTYVTSLLAAGGTFYAGTAGGVYYSTNNGSTWSGPGSGLSAAVTGLTSMQNGSGGFYIIAGTEHGGVYRSLDSGATWTAGNSGLSTLLVSSVAVNAPFVFASTQGGGVFFSEDTAQTWEMTNSSINGLLTHAMAVSNNNIYLATDSSGIFLSNDDGANWNPADTGLGLRAVYAIYANGADVFAGTHGAGVYHSANHAVTWSAANAGIAGAAVFTLASSGTNLLAGSAVGSVFTSTDNGANWSTAVHVAPNVEIFGSAAIGSTYLVATLGAGVFRSSDAGATWAQEASGLTDLDVLSVLAYNTTFFAGTDATGLFVSTDNGMTWQASGPGLPSGDEINKLATNGSNIYAGTGGHGVYLSTDGGATWNPANTGMADHYINALAASGSMVCASTISVQSHVYISTDAGGSWNVADSGLPTSSANALLFDGSNILATDGGVYLTTNKGASWNLDGSVSGDVNCLAGIPDGHGGTSRFAGTQRFGVWRESALPTVNSALVAGWNMVSVPLTVSNFAAKVVYAAAVSPVYSFNKGYQVVDTVQLGYGYWAKYGAPQSVLYIGPEQIQDTLSVNAGWNIIGSSAIAISTDNVLPEGGVSIISSFYGYNGTGYYPADSLYPGQAYWVKFNQAGPVYFGPYTHARRKKSGRHEFPEEFPPPPPGQSRSPKETASIPTAYFVGQNYPNPFNPTTKIEFALPEQSKVRLTIFNVLGQEVARLVDGVESAGHKSVSWNSSSLPAGLYFYRLDAAGMNDKSKTFTEVKKMLLIK